MSESFVISGRDMILFAIPFVSLILVSQFRLSGIAKPPKGSVSRSKRTCGINVNGEPVLRDPDGRVSGDRNRRK
jgi:hypothetical protein